LRFAICPIHISFFCAQQKVDSICRTKRIFAKTDSLGRAMILFYRFCNTLKHIALRDLPDLKLFFLCAAKGGFDLSHQKNICKVRFTWSRHDIVLPFFNTLKHIALRDLPDLNVLFLSAAKGGFDLSHQKNILQRQIYLVAP
jgi:hypothetical protein